MRKLWSILALLTIAATLAACGGSNEFAPSSGGSSAPANATVAKLSVTSSAATLPPDGSVTSTITVTATDSNNVAVPGAAVTFAASAGTVSVTSGTTSSTGQATATLSAQNVTAGTTITVTATVGGVSGKTTISVANTQQTLTLLTSAPQLPSDNSKAATITAILRNASNQLVPGATVTFSASSGAITPASGVTDANGSAIAMLTTPADQTNRTITVTATVGSTPVTVTVAVVGTSLTLTGPSSLILGSGPGTFNVSLADSGSNGISGTTVTLTSASGNTLTPASVVTDPTGHATFQMTGTVAGADTITASALGLIATQVVAVSNQSFAFTAPLPNSTIPLNSAQPVSVVWKSGGVPVAVGSTVAFSTTRGYFGGNPALTTTTAATDATGTATVSVSSTTAGPAIITASATGVTTQVSTAFVATVPNAIAVQASPATIPVSGQSTIQAVVRDANNNLVTGQVVDFQLTDTTGGSISVATATTDIQGRAQTVYTATSTASSSGGVQVKATVDGTSISSTVSLTVGGQTVKLSLGTGNMIGENTAQTQFIAPYVIQALDSAGNAVPNVTVTLTVHSLSPIGAAAPVAPNYTATTSSAAYAKGYWVSGTPWTQHLAANCLNEDVDGTGVYSSSEDLNGNGILDPGDVAAVSPGSVVTDSTGTANVVVTYPEDHALWVQVKLTATATVSGTEATTSATFWLPMLASKLATATIEPPGVTSPYGQAASCANPN